MSEETAERRYLPWTYDNMVKFLMYKTEPCLFYERGRCRYGATACRNYHGENDRRSVKQNSEWMNELMEAGLGLIDFNRPRPLHPPPTPPPPPPPQPLRRRRRHRRGDGDGRDGCVGDGGDDDGGDDEDDEDDDDDDVDDDDDDDDDDSWGWWRSRRLSDDRVSQ